MQYSTRKTSLQSGLNQGVFHFRLQGFGFFSLNLHSALFFCYFIILLISCTSFFPFVIMLVLANFSDLSWFDWCFPESILKFLEIRLFLASPVFEVRTISRTDASSNFGMIWLIKVSPLSDITWEVLFRPKKATISVKKDSTDPSGSLASGWNQTYLSASFTRLGVSAVVQRPLASNHERTWLSETSSTFVMSL